MKISTRTVLILLISIKENVDVILCKVTVAFTTMYLKKFVSLAFYIFRSVL